MSLDELRTDLAKEQKKGIPFILASAAIWALIAAVTLFDLPVMTRNLLVFCCSCPLLPLAMLAGKILHVDIFSKRNPLSQAGFLFTLNQYLYLLIVMWVYSAVPEKMIMVHAMVFGAHLLPYSWLYRSPAYRTAAIVLPVLALILGHIAAPTILALVFTGFEILFVFALHLEVRTMES